MRLHRQTGDVRLEPGRGWRLRDQWGGKSPRESRRPELVLDVEKERTRRSVKVKFKPVGGVRQGGLHRHVSCAVPQGPAFSRAFCWI